MSDWKERESLLSKFLTRKHTYHQDILLFCSLVYKNMLDFILPFEFYSSSVTCKHDGSRCSIGSEKQKKTRFSLVFPSLNRIFATSERKF